MCFIDFDNDELARGTTLIQRTIISCWNNAVGLGSIVCHTKSKKNDGNGNGFVDDEPFIDKRKPLSTMVAKGVSNNGPSSTTVAKNVSNNKPIGASPGCDYVLTRMVIQII